MNKIWEQIAELAQTLGNDPELARDSNKSVIIGITDNEEEAIEALCVTGGTFGILVMLNRIAEALNESEEMVYDTEKTDGILN